MTNIMPLRFSTMYADDVTGDVKYMYRDLRVQEGRWTSRDPIEEVGGINLNSFLRNSPTAMVDVLGYAGMPVGARVEGKELFGHAYMYVFDVKYGFGPADLYTGWETWRNYSTMGSTDKSHQAYASEPNETIPIYIRRTGVFRHNRYMTCSCATQGQILECADWYEKTWDRTPYIFPTRTCRTYVDSIIDGCCLAKARNWQW